MECALDRLGPMSPWIRRYYEQVRLAHAARLIRRMTAKAAVPTRFDLVLLLGSGDELLVEPVLQDSGPPVLVYSVLWSENRPAMANDASTRVKGFHVYPTDQGGRFPRRDTVA